MLHPVPRVDRGDLFAIISVVGLILAGMAVTFLLSL